MQVHSFIHPPTTSFCKVLCLDWQQATIDSGGRDSLTAKFLLLNLLCELFTRRVYLLAA